MRIKDLDQHAQTKPDAPRCAKAPPGCRCSRYKGHEGPCAAHLDSHSGKGGTGPKVLT